VYKVMTGSLTFVTDVHFHHAVFAKEDEGILTRGPCIEFATFYDVQEGFEKNTKKFAKGLDEEKPKGYFSCVSGGVIEELKRDGKGECLSYRSSLRSKRSEILVAFS